MVDARSIQEQGRAQPLAAAQWERWEMLGGGMVVARRGESLEESASHATGGQRQRPGTPWMAKTCAVSWKGMLTFAVECVRAAW